jgi:hypothetical protein
MGRGFADSPERLLTRGLAFVRGIYGAASGFPREQANRLT